MKRKQPHVCLTCKRREARLLDVLAQYKKEAASAASCRSGRAYAGAMERVIWEVGTIFKLSDDYGNLKQPEDKP